MIKANHLLDYKMEEEAGDMIRFTRRSVIEDGPEAPPPSQRALEAACLFIPGVDVYALEMDCRAFWVASGRPKLRAADAAFVGFLKMRAQKS